MKKRLLFIYSIFLLTLCAFADNKTDSNAQISLDISEGQRFTNSVAVGIIFSSMSKCVGENPDSEIAKVAGSLLVSTAIAEFHKAKLDQVDPYHYTYDQTGLVNDAQKLSITGEQIINNKKYLNVLHDKRYSEESVKNSLEVAESVAYRELMAMEAHEIDCIAGIKDGAYKPILRVPKTVGKSPYWIYGECARDWGDSHYYFTEICPKWKAAENAYNASAGKKESGKLKSNLESARALCQRGANGTAHRSRMFDINSPADCLLKCGIAAEVSLVCKPVQKIVREYGLPTIRQLLVTAEPSSYNAAKILKVHHNTFTKMYQVCKRDEVLSVLKKIKSVSTKVDPQFEKLQGDSAEIYQKYGGLATTDLNVYRTDVNRSADDVHKVELGDEPLDEEIKEFKIAKENLFNDIPLDTTIIPPGKPICGDWAARACGEYSKLLMKSLNSCSETLHSTVYQKLYHDVINHYAATPSEDLIFYKDILDTFKYFTTHGMDLITPSAHAKSMTATVGGAIGLGGDWLNILFMNQRNLINTFDPLLSTYNKRILAYQIARDLIDLSLTNTKKSIQRVETRLVELNQIKSTLEKTNPMATLPIISASLTEKVDHKRDSDIKGFLDIVCNQADCSQVSKNISASISELKSSGQDVNNADKSTLKATGIVSSIGDNLFQAKKITKGIQAKMSNLKDLENTIGKSRLTLQAVTSSVENSQNKSKLGAIKNDLLKILTQDSQVAYAKEKTVRAEKVITTDESVFYTSVKETNKPLPENATITNNATVEIEYEEFTDKNLSVLQNDIVVNDDVTLWDIISSRYFKSKERLESF